MAYHCKICASNLAGPLRLSPKGHERQHGNDERACEQCWEAWLSLQVEERKPDEIQCMFCTSQITGPELASLARKATGIRYQMKVLQQQSGFLCMDRCKQSLKEAQDYVREQEGRVFTCKHCHFQVCVDCDRPEHHGENCDEYSARQQAAHGCAEALTRKAFKRCPDCDALVKPEKASCHTQCDCGYRFCSACMIPWVGEGSAYLVGKQAHLIGCRYRTRAAESIHSLTNRWV